ncbi:MAG: hypothetical protein QOC57_298, partial [Ilumatobacteraceae bacterium]
MTGGTVTIGVDGDAGVGIVTWGRSASAVTRGSTTAAGGRRIVGTVPDGMASRTAFPAAATPSWADIVTGRSVAGAAGRLGTADEGESGSATSFRPGVPSSVTCAIGSRETGRPSGGVFPIGV